MSEQRKYVLFIEIEGRKKLNQAKSEKVSSWLLIAHVLRRFTGSAIRLLVYLRVQSRFARPRMVA